MSLSTVKTHLSTLFGKIGTDKDDDTKPPPSKDNRFSAAWEYFVADYACSYWKKRREKAKKDADELGLLIPAAVGDTIKCYKSAHLEITAKTNNPSKRLDEGKLVLALTKKMPLAAAKQLVESCKVDNSPATTYSVVSPAAE